MCVCVIVCVCFKFVACGGEGCGYMSVEISVFMYACNHLPCGVLNTSLTCRTSCLRCLNSLGSTPVFGERTFALASNYNEEVYRNRNNVSNETDRTVTRNI